jgi:Rps23 Pro-64 3,4-dihydroxylase Tpa1-like proline 4-hydroxylase
VGGMIPTLHPFPHIILRDWFDAELLDGVAAEFPDADSQGWQRFDNPQERKLAAGPALWGKRTRQYFDRLNGRRSEFDDAFGIPGLTMETIGGGFHLIPPGGYLDVHSDFSVSPSTRRFRRLNVLTFLNKDWQKDDGGHLELWDHVGPVVEVAPEFGTTVAFVTSATSWHGHPIPTKRYRASIAAYFFTVAPPPDFVNQSTVWHPNGGRA